MRMSMLHGTTILFRRVEEKALCLFNIVALIHLPRINDPRGNLTFIEGGRRYPFELHAV